MPDRRVVPTSWRGGRLSPGEGKTGWVTVVRFRQWTRCWLRNGLWRPPCFGPAARSGTDRYTQKLGEKGRAGRRGPGHMQRQLLLGTSACKAGAFFPLQVDTVQQKKRCVWGYAYWGHPHFWMNFKCILKTERLGTVNTHVPNAAKPHKLTGSIHRHPYMYLHVGGILHKWLST